MLASDSVIRRPASALALPMINPNVKEVIPVLNSLLEYKSDDDINTQIAAAHGLACLGPNEKAKARAFFRNLKDHPRMRPMLVLDKDNILCPTKHIVETRNTYHIALASIELWKLKDEPTPPVSCILENAKRQTKAAQEANKPSPLRDTIILLREIGPEAKDAIPLLKSLFAPNQKDRNQLFAAITLRAIDPTAMQDIDLTDCVRIE